MATSCAPRVSIIWTGAKILAFDGSGISEIAYEDTEHYVAARDFLNHYQRRLEQLLASDQRHVPYST